MPEPLLQLHGLEKRFGGLTVTAGVSLTVRTGEIHALIGPNGAGKTTLIGLINGTVAPDAGTVRLNGHDITSWPVARRARLGLARCFQISSIIPGFTALENAALAAQSQAGSSFRFCRPAATETNLNAAAMAALAQVNLTHRASIPAANLSHGEKRQLELAMVLAVNPKLLLLDEPLAGAGPEETSRLISLLASLRHRFGILLVEHDINAVFALADRISVLVYGRIIATGDATAIRHHPKVRSAYLGEDAEA